MGAVGFSVTVSGGGDRDALYQKYWQRVSIYLSNYNARPWHGDIGEYINDVIREEQRAGRWGPDGDELTWWFTDFDGCRVRSANLWLHWVKRIFAFDWSGFETVARQHRLVLAGERPSLRELLTDTGDAYQRFSGSWWSVSPEGLRGDDAFVPVAELTSALRAKHAQALEHCLCGVCRALRRRLADRRQRAAAGVSPG